MPLMPALYPRGVSLQGPSADGTSGQALVTDGSGSLSFAGPYLPTAGGTMSGNIAMGSNNITGIGTLEVSTLFRTPTMYFESTAPQFRMYDTNGSDPNDWLYWLYNTQTFYLQWRDQSAATYYDLIRVNCSSTPTGTLYGSWGVGEASPDYKLDVNGSLGITPGTSVTPADNGDIVFEFTDNTTVTIKGRGTDGTVRSGTVTLA